MDLWIAGAFVVLSTGHVGAINVPQASYTTEEQCEVVGVPIAQEMLKMKVATKQMPPFHYAAFGCYRPPPNKKRKNT